MSRPSFDKSKQFMLLYPMNTYGIIDKFLCAGVIPTPQYSDLVPVI